MCLRVENKVVEGDDIGRGEDEIVILHGFRKEEANEEDVSNKGVGLCVGRGYFPIELHHELFFPFLTFPSCHRRTLGG